MPLTKKRFEADLQENQNEKGEIHQQFIDLFYDKAFPSLFEIMAIHSESENFCLETLNETTQLLCSKFTKLDLKQLLEYLIIDDEAILESSSQIFESTFAKVK